MIVLIDLDNTLINNPFGQGVFPYLARMFRKEKSDIDYVNLFEQEGVRRRRDKKLLESYDWDSIIASVASSLDLNVSADVEQIVRMFCRAPYISSSQGAVEFLRNIRNSAHKVVFVSNGYMKYQLPVIQALHLDSSYDNFITADRIGFAKPQSEFFKHAMESVGSLREEKAMIVGDSLIYDIWGGAIAGLTPIWLTKRPNHGSQRLNLRDLQSEIFFESKKEGLEWLVDRIPEVDLLCIQELSQLERHDLLN